MIKKGNLYHPSKDFKKKALIKNQAVYAEANKNPIKFWEKLAKEIHWKKKWRKAFEHNPPYFKWFVDGKMNITESCLDINLEERKNKVALIWESENVKEPARYFTYYQLYREVNQFANGLKKIGVKKGDRVGIYLPMIPETIIAMLACARIGAIHVVVFSAFSPSALNVRLQETKAKVIITADGYYRRGDEINLKNVADEGLRETEVKKTIIVKRLGNKINFKEERDLWWDDVIAGQSDECAPKIMDAEDPLFILYTSGSTGKPKGIVHACGGYAVQAKFTGKWIFDLKDDDIFWSTADVGWVTGHTYSVYAPLLNGATYLIFEGAPDYPNPDRWCQTIEKFGVTTFYTAPTAIRMFEKYGTDLIRKYDFKNLQLLGSVGEPIDGSSWEWYYKEVGKKRCPIVDTWWQTETGGILITSLPGVGPFRPSFTGLPFPGVKFDILDDKGKSSPTDKQGNLVMLPPFSPGLLRGVYKNHKKYLDTYWSEYGKEIYFTSDLAYRDKNKLIRVVGRSDDVIKVAGHRLSTGEMEDTISKINFVLECAVIGVPHEIKGETPLAFVVLKEPKDIEEVKKSVVERVRVDISPIALPQDVHIVPDLPKTRSGKIMRRILRKLFTKEELGDLSTLANPESVDEIKKILNI
ncbi:MAG: acetate--CoA ligase [Candidatus Nealsonbacteria bacterium]|nr:acetate--CoA ligase [Candidatus Nealsonbacteria bacterium]